MAYSVMLTGANGQMGKVAQKAISMMDGFNVASLILRPHDLKTEIEAQQPDIAIELAGHKAVFNHCQIFAENNIPVVIGSSGLNNEQINLLKNEHKIKGLLVPNFSMAVAQFSKSLSTIVATYNPDQIEIIEYHHTQKRDAPSGTARHLASILKLDEKNIMSVRDDEYHARHDVVLKFNNNETITLSVESQSRDAYISGIQTSCRYVASNPKFKIGLESIL